MNKAKAECLKLINKIKQNKIAEIYTNEVNKNLFKFDGCKYLSIYKHG